MGLSTKVVFLLIFTAFLTIVVSNVPAADAIAVEKLTAVTSNTADEWCYPAWSPDGDEILFRRDGELYKVFSDGSGEIHLTNTGGNVGFYSWSPDGSKILYSSITANYACDLWVMNSDGSSATRVTSSTGEQGYGDGCGAWSPDGSKIAYVSEGEAFFDDYYSDIHVIVMDSDGSNKQAIEHSIDISYCAVAWSPDSSKIAFTEYESVVVVNSDGSGVTTVADGYIEPQTSSWQSEVWSPDGSTILCWYPSMDGDSDVILTAKSDGSGTTQLTANGIYSRYPRFSPDGSRIVFSSSEPLQSDNIWVMDADGDNKVQLTTSPARDTCPVWSPDGTKIAFCSDRDGYNNIWVMELSEEESQESPAPEVVSVAFDPQDGVYEDETATIFVKVKNNGGKSSEGYITVSFPNNEEIISQEGNGDNVETYPAGSEIWGKDGIIDSSQHPLVELYKSEWETGQEENLTIEVKPNEGSDEIVFLVRAALKNDATGDYERDPVSSDEIDQQGWYAYRHVIDVYFEEVKFRGKILEETFPISFYYFDVEVDEILDDPAGNLNVGDVILVTGHRDGPAQVDDVTVGDDVEVFGEYQRNKVFGEYLRDKVVFLSHFDELSSEHYVIIVEGEKHGSLTVTIEPPLVRLSPDALWKLTSGPDQDWHSSGYTVNDLPVGTYTINFNDVSGWIAPPDSEVTINEGPNSKSGTYSLNLGTLTVTIEPPEVRSDARWRLASGENTEWHSNAYTILDIPLGSYLLQFNDVPGWFKPADREITVEGDINLKSGTYTKGTSLTVTIEPPEVQSTARWRLESGSDTSWHPGGYTFDNIAAGNYSILFNDVAGWETPLPVTITVNEGSNSASGTYKKSESDDGSLTVNIEPSEVGSEAQWRLTSGPDTGWHSSGETIENLEPGSYTVQFNYVSGDWIKPGDIPVSIKEGSNSVSATYTKKDEEGSLTVTIEPEEVRSQAKWRLTSGPDTEWKQSGDTVPNIPVGEYTIELSEVTGWTASSETIQINEGSNSKSVTYTKDGPKTGSLMITIDPYGVRLDAEWKLASGPDTNWHKSGDTVQDIPLGVYDLEFKYLEGWEEPSIDKVTIEEDLNTLTVTYKAKPDLMVEEIDFSPQEPEVGDFVTVNSATIINEGDEDCNYPFDVALYVRGTDESYVKVKSVTLESLPSKKSEIVNFDYKWEIKGKKYFMKVVVDENKNIDEVSDLNNDGRESFSPKPSIKIVTPVDGTLFEGDGKRVPIKIEYYTPDKADIINLRIYVPEDFTEYARTIRLSSDHSNPLELDIPALPVYNSGGKHVIEVKFNKGSTKKELIDSDKVTYTVKPASDPNMVILTNPVKLMGHFGTWGPVNLDILNDIQMATDDDGILLYTEESVFSYICDDVRTTLKDLSNVEYLFILGGQDVISYYIEKDDEINVVGDWPYWDLYYPFFEPDVKYARLPTNYNKNSRMLDMTTNKIVFDNILSNEVGDEKIIKRALFLCGHDETSKISDNKLSEVIGYGKTKLIEKGTIKYVIKQYDIKLNWPYIGDASVEGLKYTNSYNEDDLRLADFIFIVGHGSPQSVALIQHEDKDKNKNVKNDNLVMGVEYELENEFISQLSFSNSLSGGSILYKRDTSGYYISSPNNYAWHKSDPLSNPVVLTDSCLTADTEEASNGVPLSNVFMHFNAGSYAGYGCPVKLVTGTSVTKKYLDLLTTRTTLGNLHSNTIENSNNELCEQWIEPFESIYTSNLKYFIQFGYPKWKIDPDGSVPDYSNPSLMDSIHFRVSDYDIDILNNEATFSFSGVLNNESVNSTNWTLQGNPVIPYIHLVYDLPEGKALESLSFDTAYQEELGQYNLTMMSGTYSGSLYEYYPLNLTAYMEESVKWKTFERTNGNMSVVIDIFPFQYYPEDSTVIFYNNFTINTSQTDRTASIDGVSVDKSLYAKGDTAEIIVNCTGEGQIKVAIEGIDPLTQQITGSNVFSVDTDEFGSGSYDVDIKLYDGDVLLDETLTAISVVDELASMSLNISADSVAKGSPLNVSVLVSNEGNSVLNLSPELVVSTENESLVDLGSLDVPAHESRYINTTVDTGQLPYGLAILYAEEELDTFTVSSNYESVTVYEDVSNIIIGHEARSDVVKLTFSSPYVDNVHYSLDEGFEELLEEPYEIDISGLENESTHNVTVYADDVFGNENSTSFQFTRIDLGTDEEDDSSNGDDNGGSSSSSSSKSSSSGGGGGGGGGAGSPEPASNVEVKELSQQFVTNGNHVKFGFPRNVTCITYVDFDPKRSLGKVTTIVEMLKGVSKVASTPPSGMVYRNANIWVGNAGTASPDNIENAVVGFRVEKAWIASNGVDESEIGLSRYSEEKWGELSARKIREDSSYIYFEAETPGFSPFSITVPSMEGGVTGSAELAAEGEDIVRGISSELSSENNSSVLEASAVEGEYEVEDGNEGAGTSGSMTKILLSFGLLSVMILIGFMVAKKQS